MGQTVRFGVSLDAALLKTFDGHIARTGYGNRSEAIRDLIRGAFVRREWQANEDVAGVITLVYDHHIRELVTTLTDIQHDYHGLVLASQHIHLDHHTCLETVVVRGRARDIERLAGRLSSERGVKFGTLTAATTARTMK